MSGPVGATVLTVYTIGGVMRLHLRGPVTCSTQELVTEASKSMDVLLSALA